MRLEKEDSSVSNLLNNKPLFRSKANREGVQEIIKPEDLPVDTNRILLSGERQEMVRLT